jgi:hypothetical protein
VIVITDFPSNGRDTSCTNVAGTARKGIRKYVHSGTVPKKKIFWELPKAMRQRSIKDYH